MSSSEITRWDACCSRHLCRSKTGFESSPFSLWSFCSSHWAVRLVLFLKALPGMSHDPLFLVGMWIVGFLYDCS